MKFLKTAVERSNKLGGVKGLLHREVGGFEPARSKKEIHASDLTKEVEYCPRQIRLMEKLGKKEKDQWIPMTLRLTFDEGTMKQGLLNNKYLKNFMVGEWRYTGTDAHGLNMGGWGHCDKSHPEFEYREPFFKDPISEAQGSVDALIRLPEQEKLRVTEVKIIATSMYPKLLAPLAEHKLRTQFYLSLIARSDHPHKDEIDFQKASVLYWLRGHGMKDEHGEITPFKEFIVKRDDEAVEYLFSKALALTLSRGNDCALPSQICPHQMCSRAEKCPVSKECFSNGST
jgi:hypothetical protein